MAFQTIQITVNFGDSDITASALGIGRSAASFAGAVEALVTAIEDAHEATAHIPFAMLTQEGQNLATTKFNTEA